MTETDDTQSLAAELTEPGADTYAPQATTERPRKRAIELTPEEERVCDKATD